MNVIELLKKDHAHVARLFEAFEAARQSHATAEKHRLLARIRSALTAHATLEDEFFYPAVEARAGQQRDGQTQYDVSEAHEEHQVLETLVTELGSLGLEHEQLDATLKVLRELVANHVDEEETELMPRARRLLSLEELDALGARCERRRRELLPEAYQDGAPQRRARPALKRIAAQRPAARRSARLAREK